jgi:predicted dehydrogenase
LQTGSMYRSSPQVRLCCELVRNGRIGQLKRVIANVAPNNAVSPGPGWQPMPVPEGFDYETWLGPAPAAAYHVDRCFYRFRFILDYSGGQTTNFGAHSMDIAQWGMGTDDTGPVEVEDLGSEFPAPGSLFTAPTKIHFCARYANGVELICQTAEASAFGTRFEGTDGAVEYRYKGVHSEPESLANTPIGPNEIHLRESVPGAKSTSTKYIPDHVRNFLDAIKSRQDPISSVDVGHHTANICHLGNIAMRLKRKIRWDPAAEKIIGDDEASRMLTRPMREPWGMEKLA